MAAFFLKKKKEVTETVEEPQKTVEAAKKEAETVNTAAGNDRLSGLWQRDQ